MFSTCLISLLLLSPSWAFSIQSENDVLRFFVLADWGGMSLWPYTTPTQKMVARSMTKRAQQTSPDFIMALGDNFYSNGVKNVDDKRFKKTFENVFDDESLQIPWYLVAGNHDWRGNVSAQIEYSKRSTRWNFPDYFYHFSYTTSENVTIAFVMLDSDVIEFEPKWYNWIAEKLDYYDKLGVDYLFLAAHHPIWSVGLHGPTEYLVENLEPMLYKYKVSGFLSGHNHALERYEVTKYGHSVTFLVSGDACIPYKGQTHKNDVPKDSLKFFDAPWLGGFLAMDVTRQNIKGEFISAWKNDVEDVFTLDPRIL